MFLRINNNQSSLSFALINLKNVTLISVDKLRMEINLVDGSSLTVDFEDDEKLEETLNIINSKN